jgi:nucleotide-binding universal stress UspA family protein
MSTVLIAYDGSPDARHAITETARLLPDTRAVVLYVRQPLESVAAHLEGHPAIEDVRDIDLKTVDAAETLAAEGADQARGLGLAAKPRVATYPDAVVADVIVDVAEQLDASLIVLGSRGRRGLAALLAGSTSTHVLHAAHRPVLVIPSTPLAAARRQTASNNQPATDVGTTDDRPT